MKANRNSLRLASWVLALVSALAGCGESTSDTAPLPGVDFQRYDPQEGYAALYVTWETGSGFIVKGQKRHSATITATDLALVKALFTEEKRAQYEPDSELDNAPSEGNKATASCPPSKESSVDPATGANLCLPPQRAITNLEYVVSTTDEGGYQTFFALFDSQNSPATASMLKTLEDLLSRYGAK